MIRDERKNRICNEFMLPLARAGAAALRRADHRTLLQWLIEVFFEQRRLWAQQQSHEEEECEEPPEIDPKDFDYRQSAPGVRGLWLWGPLDAFGEARAKVGEFYWQQAIHPGTRDGPARTRADTTSGTWRLRSATTSGLWALGAVTCAG